MPLNKKLIHFNAKSNFMSAENGVNNSPETPTGEDGTYGNLKGTSIVFIKDSKEIWTHGNLYKSVNWDVLGEVGGEQSSAVIVNLLNESY